MSWWQIWLNRIWQDHVQQDNVLFILALPTVWVSEVMSTELQEAMSATIISVEEYKIDCNFFVRKLIRDMAPMMDPEEDYITIAATEQQTSATKANRKKELEEAHSNLKGVYTRETCIIDLPVL